MEVSLETRIFEQRPWRSAREPKSVTQYFELEFQLKILQVSVQCVKGQDGFRGTLATFPTILGAHQFQQDCSY